MYLSKLVLDPRNRQVRQDLANCQELHRTLLRAFPDGAADDIAGARARCGLLYRVEIDRTTRRVAMLVQSAVEPDWSRLPAGYATHCSWKSIAAAYEAITAGMRLRFRLRANPTRRIARARDAEEARWVGKRVQLFREEDQLAWLARKGWEHGFRLIQVRTVSDRPVSVVQVSSEGVVTGRKTSDGQVHPLTFGSVLFEGELEVTDATAFRAALVHGIGPAKAYGFGLLSVARPVRYTTNRARSDEGLARAPQSAG
jgi:CRISPR system Cascade subunit CasE